MRRLPWTRSPQERFARQVLRAVRAMGAVASAGYDADDFSIAVHRRDAEPGSEAGRIYLENTFRETRGMGRRQRAERIGRLAGIVVRDRSYDSWEQARPKLRPVIRPVSYGVSLVPGQGSEVQPLWRAVLPFLAEMVVVDEPTSMSYVSAPRLAGWSVSEDELFAAARENLSRLAPIPGEPGDGGALLRFVDDGDAYFTSMLLVPGFLAGLATRVGGRPVAFIPDRDTLLVAPDESDALAGLFPMIEREYHEASRGLSPAAYTVDDRGAVVPYEATANPELARLAHRARTLLARGEYAAQKQALDARHERDDIDIFVATLLAVSRPDGSVLSLAVWSENVDTLLPEADLVAFQPVTDGEPTEGATVLTVPFDVVAREAVLVAEPDHNPPRFRVTGWPAPDVLARLRPHAVEL